jgi:hypothetical protein
VTQSEPAPHCPFLTNHAFVLVCIARSPDVRVRDVAELVGITERAAQAILSDLDRDGYIERRRIGRRNRYGIRWGARLHHPLARSATVGDLLGALPPSSSPQQTAAAQPNLAV